MTRATLVIVIALAHMHCDDTVLCGPGTREHRGQCVPGIAVDGSSCGPGTHLDPDVTACIPDEEPVICGECTTEVINTDGTVACECQSGCGGSCSGPIACPAPGSAGVSVCGRILDAETGNQLNDNSGGSICDPSNPTTDGPCAVSIQWFDAAAFAADPASATALTADERASDGCGRFRAVNLEMPASGEVAIVVDGLTVGFAVVTTGERLSDVAVVALAPATDATWSTAAGVDSFLDSGAGLVRYGVAGVQADCPRDACTTLAYLDDDDALDPTATATSTNGTVLIAPTATTTLTATGGMPADCTWPATLLRRIPGVLTYTELAPVCE